MKNLKQFHVTVVTYCFQLVKMVSELAEWHAFATYLEEIQHLKESFNHSEIIHISRMHNTRAESLACSARKQPSFVVHMYSELPMWFAES